MLSSFNNNNIKVIKPISKVVINNIQKINFNNIHLSNTPINNRSINLNSQNLVISNKFSNSSNLSQINNINRNMSTSIPKVFPKEVIIDSEEKLELIKSKKVKMARPYHWEEMKYILEKNSVEVMVRSPADEKVYMNWMKVLKSKYASING